MRRSISLSIGVGLICFGVGLILGKRMAIKELDANYSQLLEDEVKNTKQFYSRLYKADEFATPAEAAEALKSYQGKVNEDTRRWEQISHEQYNVNEHDYSQHYMTYYRGDDTLADQLDVIQSELLSDISSEIEMSPDLDCVYLRCSEMETEYEIYFSDGKYSVEVQGLDPDETG